MEVQIVSSYTVQPATPASPNEPPQTVDLTAWDLQLLTVGSIQKGLLFRKPTPQHQREFLHGSTLIDHLKNSLSRTLDFFPPLAGRFACKKLEDGATSFSVVCNGAGALFVHATVDGLTVADILHPVYVPRVVHSFFALNGCLNHEGVSVPLLAVQVTELVDGVFIGFTANHSVADGTSLWLFVNSWSEISLGSDSISNHPAFEPWFPDGTPRPIPLPLFDEHLNTPRFAPPEFQERIFHFSKENIAKLKSKANSEMGTDRISSLQAILAHIWISWTRCRRADPDKNSEIYFLIGARQRLGRSIAKGYFGNAVHVGSVMVSSCELLRRGLGWAAMEMNKMIASQTEEEVVRHYQSWVKSPKFLKMGTLSNNNLITSSSPRFNMYGNDFGWGKPAAARSGGANKSYGKMTLFPGAEEASVDVEACLLPETLHALGEDAEFMEAVSI